jgi:hypothetical protein
MRGNITLAGDVAAALKAPHPARGSGIGLVTILEPVPAY